MRHSLTVLTALILACATATASMAASPEPLLRLFFDRDVGRILGSEADSEGPKSFALKPGGGLYLLDQVNLRILEFDAQGRSLGSIPLPSPTFEDMECTDDGYLLVLDRLATETLLVLDPSGEPVLELEVKGRGIERGGAITALLPREDGVWLEVGHRTSVRVLCPDSAEPAGPPRVCRRHIITGRPLGTTASLVAALVDHKGVAVEVRDRSTRESRVSTTILGQAPVRRIVWAQGSASGRIHVVLNEATFAPASPFRLQSERYVMVTLDKNLMEISRVESPYTLTLLDQRAEYRVDASGDLWQLALDHEGLTVMKWRAP